MTHQPSTSELNAEATSTPPALDVQPVNAGAKQKAQPLYAARQAIFPKRAEGRFRRLKWIIMLITLGIYYVTPWLRWDRGSHAPDQAILIDMANRRFYFFFIEIWPQEFFYVAGLLVMAGVGLFLVTSIVGRAWCGYTCPQTVWTDLFIAVERFWQGDRNARMRLAKAPWSLDKARKLVATHATFLVISVATIEVGIAFTLGDNRGETARAKRAPGHAGPGHRGLFGFRVGRVRRFEQRDAALDDVIAGFGVADHFEQAHRVGAEAGEGVGVTGREGKEYCKAGFVHSRS